MSFKYIHITIIRILIVPQRFTISICYFIFPSGIETKPHRFCIVIFTSSRQIIITIHI